MRTFAAALWIALGVAFAAPVGAQAPPSPGPAIPGFYAAPEDAPGVSPRLGGASRLDVQRWTRLPLYAADVNDLAETPDGVLLAATYSGVFRSVDEGATWEPSTGGLPTASAIAFAATGANKVYVSVFSRGIYASTDRGVTWASTGAGIGRVVTCIEVDAVGGVYAGTGDGALLRSIDDGQTWQEVSLPYPAAVWALAVWENGVVLAGTLGRGLLRSVDRGNTWTPVAEGGPVVRVLQKLADGRVYAGTESGPGEGGQLHVSTDAGLGWNACAAPAAGGAVGIAAITSKLFAVCQSGDVFASGDEGQSWEVVADPSRWTYGLHGLLVDRHGAILLATSGHGVYRSTDEASTWSRRSVGLTGYKVEAITQDAGGALYVATSASGVFRSTDQGMTWESADAGMQERQVLSLASDLARGRVYAGTASGEIHRMASGETIWTEIGAGFAGMSPVEALAIGTDGTLWAGKGSGGGVARLPEGGSWQFLGCGLGDLSISSLAERGTGDMLAGTRSMGVFRIGTGSACWSSYGTGFASNPGAVSSMTRIPPSGTVVATSFEGVYRRQAGAFAWLETDLQIPYVHSVDSDDEGACYAGAGFFNEIRSNDVLRSTDDGATWSSIRGDLATIEPITAIHASGRDLFAGTWNGGVHVRRADGIVGVEGRPHSPAWLGSAFPNPLRGASELRFRLPRTGWAALRVVDLEGRTMITLLDERMPAGEHRLRWDGRNAAGHRVASGVYFVVLERDEERLSTKLLVIR
jgi:hypothetical protein